MIQNQIAPYLTSEDAKSFAYDTIKRRLPQDILQRVFNENDFSTPEYQNFKTIEALERLRNEMTNGEKNYIVWKDIFNLKSLPIKYQHYWKSILEPLISEKKTWLTCPWIIAEFYFYWRILDAIQYDQTCYDPFWKQKKAGIDTAMTFLNSSISDIDQLKSQSTESALKKLIHLMLMGNKSDLSLWPVTANQKTSSSGFCEQNLLVDDFNKFYQYWISKERPKDIFLIADNIGIESGTDLLFADSCIRWNWCQKFHIWVKHYPIYVSDVMVKDAHLQIESLIKSEFPQLSELGSRLKDHMKQGRLIIQHDIFFNLPIDFNQIPDDLRSQFDKNTVGLCVIKGDANYRRFVGDRHWDYTEPLEKSLAGSFPIRALALRVSKSEVVVGMTSEKVEKITKEDPKWICNGKWGMIQFL